MAHTETTQVTHATIQHMINNTPSWVNGIVIIGSAIASWLAPIASLVGITWGLLQIYAWFEKRYRKVKTQRRRVGDK